jgi:hypothetical protein
MLWVIWHHAPLQHEHAHTCAKTYSTSCLVVCQQYLARPILDFSEHSYTFLAHTPRNLFILKKVGIYASRV